MEQIVAPSWEYIGEYEHLYEQFETIELHRKKLDLLQKFYWLLLVESLKFITHPLTNSRCSQQTIQSYSQK